MKTTLPWNKIASRAQKLLTIEWTQKDDPFFARVAKRAGVSERTVRAVIARQPYAARTINRVAKALWNTH